MQDRGPELAGVVSALLAIAIVAVCIRCYVRVFLTKSIGYDDWLMVVTLVLYSLNATLLLIGVHYGVGRRTSDLTPSNFSTAMKMWFFAETTYVLSSTFTRLAAGTLLLRLTTNRVHVRIIWFIMAIASLFGISFLAEVIAQCSPTSFFWSATRNPAHGHCINAKITVNFTYAHAAVASLGDWTFGILPAFIVRGLNMNFRTKVSVFLILCFANIGSIATLIRISSIHQLAISQNFLFAAVDLAVWSSVEVGIAITAASMATYRPLFRFILSNGTTANRSYGTGSQQRHRHNSTYLGHGPPHNVELYEVKRDHKASSSSQASTSEILGMPEAARGV